MWVQLTSDRKRFGALVAVCLIGLLLWARIIIVSNPPRTAVAGQESNSSASDADEGGESTSHIGHAESARAPALPVMLAIAPNRDPFRINSEIFPKPILPNAEGSNGAKSASTSAEDALRGEEERTRLILSVAEGLALEAVMKGAQLAVIDGRMIRVGDRIVAGKEPIEFVLIEVSDRAVVLECEARRIELRMPGTLGIED
jgi:hypothetical protein